MCVACFRMDQFGIAVERRRFTHLRGRPLALHTPEGSIVAVSHEAQSAGIRPGQRTSGARVLCSGLVLLPYDRPYYEEAAHAVWDLLAVESSTVEPVCPEVCYAALEGTDVPARALRLAEELMTVTDAPVRVGVASTKFVARWAALAPPPPQSQEPLSPVTWVPPGSEAAFLAPMPLEQIEELPLPILARLQKLGLQTLGDLSHIPPVELQRQVGSTAPLLRRMMEGRVAQKVRPLWPPRSIEQRVAFDEEISDRPVMEEALRRCARAISKQLHNSGEGCRMLTLTIQMDGGNSLQTSQNLSALVQKEDVLHRTALRLLQRISMERPVVEVRLRASGIEKGTSMQLALLDENDCARGLPHERDQSLQAAMRFLIRRYGARTLFTAALMRHTYQQAGRARKIGLWTYSLGHLFDEPIEVTTDDHGVPIRFRWRGRSHQIKHIQNRWKEADWNWGTFSERTVYRVEIEPCGLTELHAVGNCWHLYSVAD
ncbi:MAG: DUF6504 family protein [Chthonomonadales bacterium]